MEIALLELDEDDSDSISSKEARKIESKDGFTEEEIKILSENEIITIENLADLATDELTEVLSIDDDKAAKLIMTAREEWFED